MNEVQTRLLRMYEEVRRSLDKHGIAFYGFFGTALGTVRHGGFIPWDDDIDLVVQREDLPAVAAALREDLDPERYYYHEPSADDHPHVMDLSKGEESLRDRTALFIDIFPLCEYPDGTFRKAVEDAAIWGDNLAIYALDRVKSEAIHKGLRWTHRFFSKLADMAAGPGCGKVTVRSTQFKEYVFPKECFGNPVRRPFEGTEIPLPEKWDAMLTKLYGDYMTPPPEPERKGAGGFPCSVLLDYRRDKKRKQKV